MNTIELSNKVRNSVEEQRQTKGFVTVVDTFIDIGILTQQDHQKWRRGDIHFLEQVCRGNLSKLSLVLEEIRHFARQKNLSASPTVYKASGKQNRGRNLRFSKSGNIEIERQYCTHYVDRQRIEQIKAEKAKAQSINNEEFLCKI